MSSSLNTPRNNLGYSIPKSTQMREINRVVFEEKENSNRQTSATNHSSSNRRWEIQYLLPSYYLKPIERPATGFEMYDRSLNPAIWLAKFEKASKALKCEADKLKALIRAIPAEDRNEFGIYIFTGFENMKIRQKTRNNSKFKFHLGDIWRLLSEIYHKVLKWSLDGLNARP